MTGITPQAKHTPWTIEGHFLKNSRNRTLADMRYIDATEQVRNLVAAAPELLDALKHAIYRTHAHSPKGCDGCALAEKAIAKAEVNP